MKLHAAAVLAAALVRTAEAGPEDKCTFPTRGDGSDPACVWDDYTTMWLPSFEHKRCCQLDATDNALCDPATNMLLTQAQCDEINQTNYDCDSASSYYAVGFTSTNWACEDYAPDCLPTLACDTENGYSGTPWIMCNADGGEFEMHGCVRGAADPDAHNEVYLPYKYMGLDLGGGNKKTSLDSAVASCDETNCAAFTAANGACNQLGECSTMGQYWVYQDAEYTDVYPDVSMDLYVNPFRWMGPPAEPQVATVDDRDNDPDGGIRISDLDFYTPMFDCYNTNKGFFKYRQQTIAELNEAMSATGLVAAQFRFTQTVYDYIVNDLGVDPDLLTSGAGEAKTTLDSAADPVGSSEYFGGIDDGTLSADVAELDGLFVGGPLMCNINNGQGCTLEGCAWMCAQTHGCAAFSIVDFCFEADVDPLRPTCAVVDDLVARSGGSATFDRSKRAVCAFHHNGEPNSAWTYAKDGAKGRAAVIVERPTNGDGSWDDACGAYNPNRCGECLECTDDASWLLQGGCQAGAPACKQPRMTLDVSTEWGYFKNDDTWTCDLCPNHCVACSDADQCNVQSCTGSAFVRNDDGTGCRELGCNVSVADFPASSVGDAAGAVSLACEEGLEVEPYDSCDIKCNTSFYQSAGSSLTAQCNGTTLQMDFPAITCSPCSEAGCVTCPSDTCTECEEGFVLSNLAQCEVATCPLPAEVGPVCEACPAHEYGTISWDAAASAWDTSACRTCGNVDSNCLSCNGTSLLDAVCIECDVGYTLDENDACIEDQQCPEGQEGTVVYDLVAAAFNFSDCATNDACPRANEAAPDCWDCPEGYRGGVVWEWTNTTHGYWSDAQCDLVACPTEGETSPACTACPWGYSGTAYWDDETETWAGCVSNDFGLSRAPRSANRAAARSTTPAVASRGVRVQRAADGMTVESVQAAPYTLNRQSSAYFHKNMGAFSSAESVWNCPPGFGGADCSLRLCPQSPTTFAAGADALGVAASEGLFWTTHLGQKSSASFHGRHAYRECAGRGVCDYVTGECDCFPGFTGRGCRRRECPNDCSGHGVCVDDATALYHNVHAAGAVDAMPPDVYPDSATSADPNLWAADHQQACMCDGGWTGHDCSLRLCPVGDDPETHCADEMAYDVQQITCTGLDKDVDHFFSLAYTTPRGVRYNTPPVLLHTFQGEGDNLTRTTDSLQTALESLPNFAIPSVEVSTAFTAIAGAEFTATMLVTFSDPVNSGEQPLLDVVYTPRCDAGASSYFVNTDTSFTCSLERVAQASDLREQAECASRGVCNTRTGECQCFDGYEGVACETISATI